MDQTSISSWHNLLSKSENCKNSLTTWSKSKFKRADLEINILTQRIQVLQNNHVSEEEWHELQELQKKIKLLWKHEEIYWNQRSRVKWLQWGDNNTSFFHASTLQRRDFNRILKIKDAGCIWVKGQRNINKAAFDFYQDIYTKSPIQHLQECIASIPNLVSDSLNRKLCSQVDIDEIKAAVFSLGDLKAPGIYGLNGLFYQKNWEVVKGDVCNAVLTFF